MSTLQLIFFYFLSLDKSKAPEHLTPGIYYAESTISLAPVRLSQNCLFKCTCVCKGRLQISKGKYANKDKTLLSANRKKKWRGKISLDFAAVVGLLEVLVQLDHPLLVLLLLDAGDLLQLTGPFALQHLIKQREIKLNSGIFFSEQRGQGVLLTCRALKCCAATVFTSWSHSVFPSSCITFFISAACLWYLKKCNKCYKIQAHYCIFLCTKQDVP